MFARKLFLCVALSLLGNSSLSGQIPAAALKYRNTVIREARAVGGLQAPSAMFGAQIHQESSWKPLAHSSVGATGLAEFMPGSAAWIAKVYPAQLGNAAPLDPNWAIRALVYYDYWNFKRLPMYQIENENRWAAALSAYNGGLGWTLKDSKIGSCTLWFGCADSVNDGRSVSNLQQNRQYPELIIHKYEPRYKAAGW